MAKGFWERDPYSRAFVESMVYFATTKKDPGKALFYIKKMLELKPESAMLYLNWLFENGAEEITAEKEAMMNDMHQVFIGIRKSGDYEDLCRGFGVIPANG